MTARPALVHDTVTTRVNAMAETTIQLLDVDEALARRSEDFFHFPWSALDALVGGMPPGDVWYVGGFSGHGKTTFLTSLVDELERAGRRTYYMGLESQPYVLWTHLACKRLGYDAGDILSGAYLRWIDAAQVRERVKATVCKMAQGNEAGWERLTFSSISYVDETALRACAAQAAAAEVDVFILDHVDHVRDSKSRSMYDESVAVNRALLEVAHEFGLRILVATQLNNEAVKGNRVALYQPPQPQYVKMGGHKREVASGMLGLYRPLKIAGNDNSTLKAFQAGQLSPADVCEPNTMAVVCMKHRLYGAREGERIYLHVERGKVLDANQDLFKSTRVV